MLFMLIHVNAATNNPCENTGQVTQNHLILCLLGTLYSKSTHPPNSIHDGPELDEKICRYYAFITGHSSSLVDLFLIWSLIALLSWVVPGSLYHQLNAYLSFRLRSALVVCRILRYREKFLRALRNWRSPPGSSWSSSRLSTLYTSTEL